MCTWLQDWSCLETELTLQAAAAYAHDAMELARQRQDQSLPAVIEDLTSTQGLAIALCKRNVTALGR